MELVRGDLAAPETLPATLSGVQTLRENLDGHDVPVPTPQGFIRWERELDAVVKIIALPDGKDPDEVIQANPIPAQQRQTGTSPAMSRNSSLGILDIHPGPRAQHWDQR